MGKSAHKLISDGLVKYLCIQVAHAEFDYENARASEIAEAELVEEIEMSRPEEDAE